MTYFLRKVKLIQIKLVLYLSWHIKEVRTDEQRVFKKSCDDWS